MSARSDVNRVGRACECLPQCLGMAPGTVQNVFPWECTAWMGKQKFTVSFFEVCECDKVGEDIDSLSLSLSLPLSPSLLSATLSYDESDFAIRQTRSRKNLDELSWQVWGVATVLLGGADANNLFYLFDCYHSTFTDGLAWVRVDADVEVNNDAFDGGGATRLRVSVDEISNYLGLYACTAPDGSMEHLNITDGEYSVVC